MITFHVMWSKFVVDVYVWSLNLMLEVCVLKFMIEADDWSLSLKFMIYAQKFWSSESPRIWKPFGLTHLWWKKCLKQSFGAFGGSYFPQSKNKQWIWWRLEYKDTIRWYGMSTLPCTTWWYAMACAWRFAVACHALTWWHDWQEFDEKKMEVGGS